MKERPTNADDAQPGVSATSTQSARKRRAILEAAMAAFVSVGYDATSMDDVARSASVSKPTIYSHFGDKAGLFRAAVLTAIDDTDAKTHDIVSALAATENLSRDLRRFARRHVADLMDPQLVRMRRRIISVAERFPELAATWYDNGPAAAVETLAEVFATLAERGLLRIDDPATAAEQFNWLVLAPLNRAMFLTGQAADPTDLNRSADHAVEMFLRAYAPAEQVDGERS